MNDPSDEVFRCVHFACRLTKRACLRRQTEMRSGGARAAGKQRRAWSKPLHPYCAYGTCTLGREVAAELAGLALPAPVDPRRPPRIDIIAAVEARATEQLTTTTTTQETSMPATICPECKSPSKHKAGCSKPPRAAAPTKALHKQPKGVGRAPRIMPLKPTSEVSTKELLGLREAIDAELRRRLEEHEQQLVAMRAALGALPAVRSAG